MKRIVVFTGGLLYSVRKGLAELQQAFPHVEWLVLEHAPPKPVKTLLKNQWRNLQKNGWRWIPYQLNDLTQLGFQRLRGAPQRTVQNPGDQYTWEAILARPGMRHRRLANIHDADSLAAVREFAPDLGIALAAPILKPALFELPRLGTINLHKGRLPFYRGMPPAFWELYNDEPEFGCTIHKVARGLDTGPILIEATLPRQRYSTVRGMQLGLDELGVELTCQAVALLQNGLATWTPQAAGGKTYTRPTLAEQAKLEHSLRASGQAGISLRSVLKNTAFWAYTYLARPVPSVLQGLRNRQRVIVLLYHRVNDDLRDAVTIGIEQFDEQMAWVSQHCTVVSIEDVLHGRVPRNTARPPVAITFDDGYLDNYEHAVPVLLRHRLPAAFFVSTGLMGTAQGFAHDLRKLGGALPNMSWEQLQHMHELGFTIGSHTVNHISCGKTDAAIVREELIQSRDHLRERLGLRETIFAYPFGLKCDMTPGVLNMVAEVGYAGCLSAYGGCNEGTINPFNVLRMNINHAMNMRAFRAKLAGFSRT